MADVLSVVRRIRAPAIDRRGVSSAEYAVLAVGIIIAVAAAITGYDLNNPMRIAGEHVTSATSTGP
jgi:Flp pilus assembly pilin Flp